MFLFTHMLCLRHHLRYHSAYLCHCPRKQHRLITNRYSCMKRQNIIAVIFRIRFSIIIFSDKVSNSSDDFELQTYILMSNRNK